MRRTVPGLRFTLMSLDPKRASLSRVSAHHKHEGTKDDGDARFRPRIAACNQRGAASIS
jgi:hypothetical protein